MKSEKPWPESPLSEIAKPVVRAMPVVPGESYRTLGVKWWGEGAYERETIDGSRTAAKTLNLVRQGDLIINKIWVRHGSAAIASSLVDGCAASGEFPTFELNLDRVVPEWIHWQTKTRGFWAKCDALSRGTSGKNRIKPELFLSIRVPLPPVPEQRRIVHFIGKVASDLDEVRREKTEMLAEAEALIVSTHRHLAGTRTRALGQILRLFEQAQPVSPEGSYPQVGVRSFGLGLFPKAPVAGTATTYRAFNRLYAGALLLSQVKGWEGAVAVCPPELDGWFVSPEYRTFQCIQAEARSGYMATLVRTKWFWSMLSGATRGVGARRERTRPEQFLRIELPMPDTGQQEKAERLFAELSLFERLHAESVTELDALLPSILRQNF